MAKSRGSARQVNVPKSVQKIPEIVTADYNDLKVNKPGTVMSNLTGWLFVSCCSVLFRHLR